MALTEREQLIQLSTKMDSVIDSQSEMKETMKELNKKIDNKFDEMEKSNKEQFVRKEEFDPVKRLVYGGVGIILVAVVGAIVALVVSSGGAVIP